MKVTELIKKLKTMPPNLDVAFRDHDQSRNEINGYVRDVEVIRINKLKEGEPLLKWDIHCLEDDTIVIFS